MSSRSKLMKTRRFTFALGSVFFLAVGVVFFLRGVFFSSTKEDILAAPPLMEEGKQKGQTPNLEEIKRKKTPSRTAFEVGKRHSKHKEKNGIDGLKLWDYLSKKTFKSLPDLLDDLGFSTVEIGKVKGNPDFFQKLDLLQKREHRKFNTILNEVGLKGVNVLVQLEDKENLNSLVKTGKVLLEDPKDPEKYFEMVLMNGKQLKNSKVFIRIDQFPEMKRLRLAHIFLVKRFTERMRRLVKSFLER